MDLIDWKTTFIKLARDVTINEVALVAVSIHPLDVDSSIHQARKNGFDNWQTAELIARLLKDAVKNNELAVRDAYVRGADTNGEGWEGYVEGSELQALLHRNRSLNVVSAKFQGREVWEWMAYHHFIDRKHIVESPPPANIALQAMRAQNRAGDSSTPNEQIANLSAQVADLSERLRLAEAEIAALKANAPTFRHMTPALELVAEIQELHWGDTWKPDIIPKQAAILYELENTYGLSNAKAKSVEYVASPIDRATGKCLC